MPFSQYRHSIPTKDSWPGLKIVFNQFSTPSAWTYLCRLSDLQLKENTRLVPRKRMGLQLQLDDHSQGGERILYVQGVTLQSFFILAKHTNNNSGCVYLKSQKSSDLPSVM